MGTMDRVGAESEAQWGEVARRPSPATSVSSGRYLVYVALLAGLYFVAGRLGLLLTIPPAYATAIWPASGIALAALLLFGYRLWPGILLGSFLVQIGTSFDGSSVALIFRSLAIAASVGIGASLQALLGTWLIKRFVGFPTPLVYTRDVLWFLALGGPTSCLTGATWGMITLWIGGSTAAVEYIDGWWTRWVADTIGVLIVTPLALIWVGSPRAIWRSRRLSVALPVGITLAVVVVLFVLASEQEQQRIKLEYERQAALVGDALGKSLGRYIEVLHAIESFYVGSERVTRREFRKFVARPLARIPGIQALSWNLRISLEERTAREEAARQEGYPGFQITESDEEGHLVPAGVRSEYIAVYYIEPYEGNEKALGYDVGSHPTRREALDAARDSAEPFATARISLVQETGTQAGILVFLPIYEEGQASATVADRRKSLQGYVTGVFRVGDLVEAALGNLGINNMVAWLYDDSANGDDRFLAAYHLGSGRRSGFPMARGQAPPADGLGWSTTYEVGGHQWRLLLTPSLPYTVAYHTWSALLLFAGGLLLTSLLGAFQLVLTGRAAELSRINSTLEREMTERKRTEEALFEAKERAQVTLHSIGDAVIVADARGSVEYLNPIAETLTGWPVEEAKGQPLDTVFRIIDEETRKPAYNLVARCLAEGQIVRLTNHTVLISRCGREYAIENSAAPIRGRSGEILGAVLVFKDATEMRRMAQKLAHQAAHDALTGLVNRREFERRLDHALASVLKRGTPYALCYLDLDQFKVVNDTVGHIAGDELLKQVAGLLRERIRARDTLARLGGDEFSLLLENCPLENAVHIAEVLVATLRDFRFHWEGRTFEIGVSIGLVPITAEVTNTAQLLTRADVACYTAKDLGRNRVYLYQEEDMELARRHTEILRVAELRDALAEGRFQLYAQPIVPLSSASSEPAHCELLLRLVDANGETLLPGAFIPAAERYGLMAAIDRWVIKTAFRCFANIVNDFQVSGIAINLSGNSLNDDTLFDFVGEELVRSTIPPERICFEITETAAINKLTQATKFITELRKSGCRFALDDFGSGLSSFTYLKHLPVDYVKIDGSFVRDMVEDAVDRAMVAAINQVGHVFGVQTIAEWAESQAVVAHLKEVGVDYVQGYAVGAPVLVEGSGGQVRPA